MKSTKESDRILPNMESMMSTQTFIEKIINEKAGGDKNKVDYIENLVFSEDLTDKELYSLSSALALSKWAMEELVRGNIPLALKMNNAATLVVGSCVGANTVNTVVTDTMKEHSKAMLDKRHKENRKKKDSAKAYYINNKSRFETKGKVNKTAAADFISKHLNVKVNTVRRWLSDW